MSELTSFYSGARRGEARRMARYSRIHICSSIQFRFHLRDVNVISSTREREKIEEREEEFNFVNAC